MKDLFLELHILQDIPFNCLNRNQDGSPKTALYGGVQRFYVSSQAWKKAVRDFFKERINEEKIGYRTMELGALVEEELINQHQISQKQAKELVNKLMKSLKLKSDKNNKLKALFAVSKDEIKGLANILVSDPENTEALKAALKNLPSVDVCLFGRMAADDKDFNVDAACQIAPAISVNEVQMDADFFTAIDDLKKTTGAGMMGTKEFTTGVIYRYACLSIKALKDNYSGDLPQLVREFVKCFVESMPKGMQNGFAANTLPYAVYAVIRDDRPISFVSAFESPVPAFEAPDSGSFSFESSSGYKTRAVKQLIKEVNEIYENWASFPVASFTVGRSLSALAEPIKLREMYSDIEAKVAAEIGEV